MQSSRLADDAVALEKEEELLKLGQTKIVVLSL